MAPRFINARSGAGARLRFGPFELDPARRQLFNQHERVKLQDLPFRLLLLLIQRPGDIVSREELQRELWPDGAFVEFELGLNTAIKKVRQALQDDAEFPRFVETIPRQGYRFIGSLELLEDRPSVKRRAALVILAATLLLSAGLLWKWRKGQTTAWSDAYMLDLQRLTADTGLSFQPAISSDGKFVAYATDRTDEGNLDIWVTPVSGGDSLRLTDHSSDDSEPNFCPDGRIVFRSERDGGGIYIMPALGGNPTLLAPGGRSPRCSPDGKSVAFWQGSLRGQPGTTFVVSASGGVPRRIAGDLPYARFPVWSPDGRALLVLGHARERAHWFEGDWWVASLDGSASHALRVRSLLSARLNFQAGTPEPSYWDAQTGQVLFSALAGQTEYATWRTDIWSLKVDAERRQISGPLLRLTSGNNLLASASSASDGAVAFAVVDLNPDIWRVAVDHRTARTSGQLQPVTREKYWESRPALSSDGNLMVYRTERSGQWDFWLKDLKSGMKRPVTNSGGEKVWAAITHDGTKIAYHTLNDLILTEVISGASQIFCRNCRMLEIAGWTPEGDSVIADNLESGALELIDVADGRRTDILRSGGPPVHQAALSLDGKWIAFLTDRLYIAPFSGKHLISQDLWQLIPAGTDSRETLQWSPDGRTIYFLSDRDGHLCLWAVQLDAPDIAIPVMHFHQRRYLLYGSFAVSPGYLYIGLHESTGNVWIGKREPKGN